MNLDDFSLDELKQLKKDVDKAITSFEERRLREARQALEAQAREMGFTLSELLGTSKKGKSLSPPKYRNPEHPEMTWSGRGRKPKWIHKALERGDDLARFEI